MTMQDKIRQLMADDYRGFISALIEIETAVGSDTAKEVADDYMNDDDCYLLSQELYEKVSALDNEFTPWG